MLTFLTLVASLEWKQVNAGEQDALPPARYTHSCVLNEERDEMIIFGKLQLLASTET